MTSSIDEVTELLAAHDNSLVFPPEHGYQRLSAVLPPIVLAIAAQRPRGTAGIDITAIFEPPPPVFPREDSEAAVDLWRLIDGEFVRVTDAPSSPCPVLSICISLPSIIIGVRQDDTLSRWLRPPSVAAEHGRRDQ